MTKTVSSDAKRRPWFSALWLACALLVLSCGDDKQTTGTMDSTTTTFDTIPTDTQPPPTDTSTGIDTTGGVDTAVGTDSATPSPDTTPASDTAPSDTSVDTSTASDTGPPAADTTAPPADTTPPPAPLEVKFLVLGDTGTGSANQHAMAATIASKCAADGCDFALLTGDNIYDSGVESTVDAQWQTKFEEPYAALDFPFYPALGNHDNGGFLTQFLGDTFGGAGADFERGDFQVDYTQLSDKWTMPARSYDFVHGPAHFFALDTNDLLWSVASPEAEQRAEIQKTSFPSMIDSSTSTWKFAFGHHPYISNGQHGDAGTYEGITEGVDDLLDALPWLGNALGELTAVGSGDGVKDGLDAIVCGRVDIYFCGHDHNRQWLVEIPECPETTFVVSGAGSKTKDFRQSHPTLFQDADNVGVFWFHIVGNHLHVEAIAIDGTVQWSHDLYK